MTRWTNGKFLEVNFDEPGPYVDIDGRPRSTSTRPSLKLL